MLMAVGRFGCCLDATQKLLSRTLSLWLNFRKKHFGILSVLPQILLVEMLPSVDVLLQSSDRGGSLMSGLPSSCLLCR